MSKKSVLAVLLTALAGACPALAAPGDFHVIEGTMVAPGSLDNERSLQLRGDDGNTYNVDASSAQIQPGLKAGRRLVVAGAELDRPDQIKASLVQAAIDGQPAPGTADAKQAGGWQRLHGRVEKVEGSTLTFKADDGRTLAVNMSQVNPAVQKALTPNEGATLIGFKGDNANEFRARYIQQDSSNPERGGRIVGRAETGTTGAGKTESAKAASGPVDEKAWQRIHGAVEKIDGSKLTFRADDGRTLTVDMSAVNPDVRKALTVGEKATVIGHYRGNTNTVAAQYIQQDSSAGAASPKTGR